MKIIYILMLLINLLTINPVSVKADVNYRTDEPIVQNTMWTNIWMNVPYKGIDWRFLRFHYNPLDVDAYCIEFGVEMYPDSDYSVQDYNAEHLEELARISQAVKDLGNDDRHYIAAQLMIWDLFGNYRKVMEEPDIKAAISDIKTKIKDYESVKRPKLVLEGKLKTEGVNRLKDVNSYLEKGYEISTDTTGVKNAVVNGNYIEFELDNPYVENINISVKPSAEMLKENVFNQAKVYIATSSQTLFSYNADIPLNYETATFKYERPKSKLIFKKYNEAGELFIEKIKINLYQAKLEDGKYVVGRPLYKEALSVNNGQMIIDNLVEAHYFIKEVECPENYVLDDEYHLIEINNINENEFKMFNKLKRSSVVIEKYDDLNHKLTEGLSIDVYTSKNEQGNLVPDKKVNQEPYQLQDGQIKINNLLIGDYFLKEIDVPTNMIKNEEYIPIKIEYDKNNYFKLVNKLKRCELEITKLDSNNQLVNDEITLDIYNSTFVNNEYLVYEKVNKNPLKSINGKIIIKDLLPGKYFIKEISCPNYLKIREDFIPIEVNLDKHNSYNLVNEFNEAKIEINKYDKESLKTLTDTYFSVYDISSDAYKDVKNTYLTKINEKIDLSKLLQENQDLYVKDSDYYRLDKNIINIYEPTVIDLKIIHECDEFTLTGFDTINYFKGTIIDATNNISVNDGENKLDIELSLDPYNIDDEDDYTLLYYHFNYKNQEYLIKRYLSNDENLKFVSKLYRVDQTVKLYASNVFKQNETLKALDGHLIGEFTTGKDTYQPIVIDGLKMGHEYLICESQKSKLYKYDNLCHYYKSDDEYTNLDFYNQLEEVKINVFKYSPGFKQIKLDEAYFEVKTLNEDKQVINVEEYISGALHINQADFKTKFDGSNYIVINNTSYPISNYLNIRNLKSGSYDIKLYNSSHQLLETINKEITSGKFTIDHLTRNQHLEIKETKAPIGYKIDDDIYTIDLNTSDRYREINQYRINSLYIVKTSAE